MLGLDLESESLVSTVCRVTLFFFLGGGGVVSAFNRHCCSLLRGRFAVNTRSGHGPLMYPDPADPSDGQFFSPLMPEASVLVTGLPAPAAALPTTQVWGWLMVDGGGGSWVDLVHFAATARPLICLR